MEKKDLVRQIVLANREADSKSAAAAKWAEQRRISDASFAASDGEDDQIIYHVNGHGAMDEDDFRRRKESTFGPSLGVPSFDSTLPGRMPAAGSGGGGEGGGGGRHSNGAEQHRDHHHGHQGREREREDRSQERRREEKDSHGRSVVAPMLITMVIFSVALIVFVAEGKEGGAATTTDVNTNRK